MGIKPIETVYNGYRFRSRLEARWAVFFDALGVEYEYEPEGFELPSGRRYLPDFRVKCYGTRGNIGEVPFDLWIEIKANMTKEDADKIKEFAHFGSAYYHDDCPFGQKAPNTLRISNDDDGKWLVCDCGEPICGVGEEVPGYFTCDLSGKDVVIGIWQRTPNPIIILGDIPKPGHAFDSFATKSYDQMNGLDIYPFNYELIDGDHFAAYPAGYKGKFFLCGDDSNYIWNEEDVEYAYTKARQARFEYGETPKI